MRDYYTGQRVKRSLFAFLFGKLGSGILGFLAFALLARLLEREEFGALVASMAFVEILIGLSTSAPTGWPRSGCPATASMPRSACSGASSDAWSRCAAPAS